MPATDLPGGAPDPGFVGLSIPARGRLHLRHVALAPGYADFTPGDGPRRGWPKPVKWVETIDGHHIVWCGERRGVPGLPENLAGLTVAARLGCADLADRIGLRGDLLLAGIDATGGPADVPQTVIEASVRAGLLTNTDRGGVTAGDGRSRRGRPEPPAAVLAGRGHLHDPQSTAVVAEVETGADAAPVRGVRRGLREVTRTVSPTKMPDEYHCPWLAPVRPKGAIGAGPQFAIVSLWVLRPGRGLSAVDGGGGRDGAPSAGSGARQFGRS